MQGITKITKLEKMRPDYLLILGLLTLSAFSIALFGVKGLFISIIAIAGLILTIFLYNKPSLFLFFSLFIYPFTRLLPLDDKFVITGSLYTLSIPCALWLSFKSLRSTAGKSLYIWSMLIYMIVILFSILRPETSIIDLGKDFGRVFYAIFMTLALYNYIGSKPENLEKINRYLSYLFNVIGVIAIGQFITRFGGYFHGGFYRVRGTFFNFNEYGYVLTLFICLALYNLLTSKTSKQKFYWAFSIGLNLIAMVLTFSKTSIINAGIIFIIMSMFLPWKRKLQLFGSFTVFGALLSIFLAVSGTLNTLILRFAENSSLDWRFEIWRIMYNLVLQGNLWLGQGVDASKKFLIYIVPRGESFAPHNIYLETAYNFGIIGFIPFLLIFLVILFQGISIFFQGGIYSNQNKLIGASIITITLITMVQNFVSNAFYDRAGNLIFWVIIVLFISIYQQYKTGNLPNKN